MPARSGCVGGLARRPAGGGLPAFAGLRRVAACRCPRRRTPVVASASGVELVASDAGLPGRLQPEVSESVLVPLVNQFSMMQQQMFDQFQQAMGMLVQMFGTMHREQMEVIREELDRLHELSRELQELKEELARSPGRQAPAASAVPARGRGRRRSAAGPDPGGAGRQARRCRPGRGAIGRGPRDPSAGRRGGTAAPGRPRPRRRAVAPPEPADGAASARGPAPGPAPPRRRRPGTVGAPGAAGSPQDAVAWIHQRIASIQQERETRWQKIIKLLPGMS